MTSAGNIVTSVCIVSHNGYGAISGGKGGFVGGVERQTSLLAFWLAERGHRVSFLTWDEGGPAEEMIDGVRVIKICDKSVGLPGLRFFHPKWTSLERALREADADVYYHNCSESVTGQVAWWCSRNNRKFVFALASDADWNPLLPEMHGWYEKWLYRYGLRKAGEVICQTATQQEKLKTHWNIDSTVVPMPCPRPAAEEGESAGLNAGRVLWLGRVCAVKRLEWFLDVAERMPDLTFDLVGPFYDESYANQIHERATSLGNVVLHGRIDKERVGEFYRGASLLCCTSKYEGFPNTFLEAWSRGVPVISTFDPDGIIARERLGIHVSSVEAMKDGILEMLNHQEIYQEFSRNCRFYFEQNHTIEKVLPLLSNTLLTA